MISYFTTFLSVLYYLYILFFKLRFQFFAFLFFLANWSFAVGAVSSGEGGQTDFLHW